MFDGVHFEFQIFSAPTSIKIYIRYSMNIKMLSPPSPSTLKNSQSPKLHQKYIPRPPLYWPPPPCWEIMTDPLLKTVHYFVRFGQYTFLIFVLQMTSPKLLKQNTVLTMDAIPSDTSQAHPAEVISSLLASSRIILPWGAKQKSSMIRTPRRRI